MTKNSVVAVSMDAGRRNEASQAVERHAHHSFGLSPSRTDYETMMTRIDDTSVEARFLVLLMVRLGARGRPEHCLTVSPRGGRPRAMAQAPAQRLSSRWSTCPTLEPPCTPPNRDATVGGAWRGARRSLCLEVSSAMSRSRPLPPVPVRYLPCRSAPPCRSHPFSPSWGSQSPPS